MLIYKCCFVYQDENNSVSSDSNYASVIMLYASILKLDHLPPGLCTMRHCVSNFFFVLRYKSLAIPFILQYHLLLVHFERSFTFANIIEPDHWFLFYSQGHVQRPKLNVSSNRPCTPLPLYLPNIERARWISGSLSFVYRPSTQENRIQL